MESPIYFNSDSQGPINKFIFPDGTPLSEFISSRTYEKEPHSKLGQGGYSNVYKLHFIEKDYVLKVAEDNVPNLLKEIQTLIKLKNRWFAAQIIAASVFPENKGFILYPYIDGKTFTQFQRTTVKNAIGIKRYRAVYNDLIEATYELHQMGLVHHDIKPPNIWVPDEGRPFFLDFGLSEAIGVEKGLVGTPLYTNLRRWKNRIKFEKVGNNTKMKINGTKPVSQNINWYSLGKVFESYNPNNNSKNMTLKRPGISNNEARKIRYGGYKNRTRKSRLAKAV